MDWTGAESSHVPQASSVHSAFLPVGQDQPDGRGHVMSCGPAIGRPGCTAISASSSSPQTFHETSISFSIVVAAVIVVVSPFLSQNRVTRDGVISISDACPIISIGQQSTRVLSDHCVQVQNDIRLCDQSTTQSRSSRITSSLLYR